MTNNIIGLLLGIIIIIVYYVFCVGGSKGREPWLGSYRTLVVLWLSNHKFSKISLINHMITGAVWYDGRHQAVYFKPTTSNLEASLSTFALKATILAVQSQLKACHASIFLF